MIFEWDFLVFVAALSVAAFSPGPGLAAIVATVLAGGARRAVWFCVGVVFGDLTWLLLSLSGLALIAQQIPVIFVAIKWAGVTYLVYLAVKIWRT
ncbi:MAG: LysE family transporter, partial [bacterium]|nr:LysE family transporter [bacterium]